VRPVQADPLPLQQGAVVAEREAGSLHDYPRALRRHPARQPESVKRFFLNHSRKSPSIFLRVGKQKRHTQALKTPI